MSMEVERLKEQYGSETWAWNRAQQSRVRAVEMSYPRRACGVTRWENENKENVYD